MWLSGVGILVDGQPADPATLNAWLRANDGYVCEAGDCANLNLGVVPKLNSSLKYLGEPLTPPLAELQSLVQGNSTARFGVLAHVRDQSHFVLLIGWDQNNSSNFVGMWAFCGRCRLTGGSFFLVSSRSHPHLQSTIRLVSTTTTITRPFTTQSSTN